MGVRLYPLTDQGDVLERLANVPVGTSTRLQALEAEYAGRHADIGATDEMYDRIFADPDLSAMFTFICEGWGKLNAPVYDLLRRLDLDLNCGTVRDLELVYHILELKGVVLPPNFKRFEFHLLKGVCWS